MLAVDDGAGGRPKGSHFHFHHPTAVVQVQFPVMRGSGSLLPENTHKFNNVRINKTLQRAARRSSGGDGGGSVPNTRRSSFLLVQTQCQCEAGGPHLCFKQKGVNRLSFEYPKLGRILRRVEAAAAAIGIGKMK